MPEVTEGAAPAGGRKLLGQPWWVWAAGGVALLGGYLYLRRKAAAAGQQQPGSSAAGSSSSGTYASPTGLSWEQFLLFVHDQQSSPAPSPAPVPGSKAVGYSWTNRGQKWSVNELAARLHIPVANLHPGNRQAAKALSEPDKPMPKGAHFTYTKGGKVVPQPAGAQQSG